MIFDKDGKMVTKHRKVHLFDIDIPGRITFKESKVLSGGNQITTFTTGNSYLAISHSKISATSVLEYAMISDSQSMLS